MKSIFMTQLALLGLQLGVIVAGATITPADSDAAGPATADASEMNHVSATSSSGTLDLGPRMRHQITLFILTAYFKPVLDYSSLVPKRLPFPPAVTKFLNGSILPYQGQLVVGPPLKAPGALQPKGQDSGALPASTPVPFFFTFSDVHDPGSAWQTLNLANHVSGIGPLEVLAAQPIVPIYDDFQSSLKYGRQDAVSFNPVTSTIRWFLWSYPNGLLLVRPADRLELAMPFDRMVFAACVEGHTDLLVLEFIGPRQQPANCFELDIQARALSGADAGTIRIPDLYL